MKRSSSNPPGGGLLFAFPPLDWGAIDRKTGGKTPAFPLEGLSCEGIDAPFGGARYVFIYEKKSQRLFGQRVNTGLAYVRRRVLPPPRKMKGHAAVGVSSQREKQSAKPAGFSDGTLWQFCGRNGRDLLADGPQKTPGGSGPGIFRAGPAAQRNRRRRVHARVVFGNEGKLLRSFIEDL